MTGNPKEKRDARAAARAADRSERRILSLPQQVGGTVRWPNGVLWTRAGDDDWRSDGTPHQPYPSAHVAWGMKRQPRFAKGDE